MKMIKLFIIIILPVFIGCQSDSIKGNCSAVHLTTELTTLTSIELFSVQEVKVAGNTLTIQFAYGGGCDPDHKFELYLQPLPSTSLSAFEGRVVFTTKDPCKRLDTKEFCFDLTELKSKYPSGSINIRGFKEPVVF
ncbi:hypothetical protein [Runella sp.]|uniref:hypothetical protein n=1 Tax=Runella sp. TaxID=1960881 RepID=UPI003D095C1B